MLFGFFSAWQADKNNMLAARVIDQLGALERGRFDPGAQGAIGLSQALEGVRTVVRELERTRRKGVA